MVINRIDRLVRWLERAAGRSRSIRQRVFSIIAVVLAPLCILALWMAFNYAAATRRLIEHQRLDVTRGVSAAIDQDISVPLGMLIGLAADEDITAGRFEAFEREAKRLVVHPTIDRIWVMDRSGRELASSGGAARAPSAASTIGVDFIARVFSGKPAVSSVFGEGEQTRAAIAVPVGEPDRVALGIAAEISIAPLSRLFAEAGLDPKWAAAVVDLDGHYVARSLAQYRLGQLARPELKQAAQNSEPEGVFENVTYEGLDAVNSYKRSVLTGWTTVVASPRSALVAPLWKTLAAVLVGGGAIVAATIALASLLSRTISEPVRALSAFASALASGEGGGRASSHGISELDEVRAVLEREIAQSARLAAIVASSGDAIMSIDLDGNILTWNKGAEDLFGYPAADIVGKKKTLVVPPDKLAEFEVQRSRVMQGETIRAETVRMKRDGTRVYVSLDTAPIRRGDGVVTGISSIIHDISERKASEAHKLLLMAELAHRSKNQLAIIQSIAKQTARNSTSPQEFIESFRQRLQGLAASHDLLSSQDRKTVPLRDLTCRQIEIFTGGDDRRVEVRGPDVQLKPAVAEGLGLALHELATNSIKYGALSKPGGSVCVEWAVVANGKLPSVLRLQWTERGGPTVEAPKVKGFGSQVIETLVARSLNGTSTLSYQPEGVHWQLECPLTPYDDLPNSVEGR